MSSVLQGLKHFARPSEVGTPLVDITAIVTVTDDGGSSGRLRREFDVLPPGDIRNCMVALSEDSALLSRLFQHRFQSGRGLKGHSFGNLFLMALTQIMGDFPDAVKASSEVLKIAGRHLSQHRGERRARSDPDQRREGGRRDHASAAAVTADPVDSTSLPCKGAALPAGRAHRDRRGGRDFLRSRLALHQRDSQPSGRMAIPSEAIRSSSAIKCYFVNLMSQPGETTAFRASDHRAGDP